jgi:hypothetical protein
MSPPCFSASSAASGKRSKNAVPSKVPAAKEARKCEILRANFSFDKRIIQPISDPILPIKVNNKMYSNVDMMNRLQKILGSDWLL